MKTPKTHPLNVSYLVVGLVFLGIAGSWALRTSGAVDTEDVRWLGPLVLVTAGVVGLVAFAAKGLGRNRDDEALEEPTYDPYSTYSPYQGDEPYETDETEPTTRLDDHTQGEPR
jgi:hypothetical protein